MLTRERGENCIPPSDEDSNLEDAPAVIKLSNAGSLDKVIIPSICFSIPELIE